MIDAMIKTSFSNEELEEAMTDSGAEKAFETYKSKGGSASQDSFLSQWKSLIGRMINGFSNNMGVSIAEEKYKRKNYNKNDGHSGVGKGRTYARTHEGIGGEGSGEV